MTKEQAVKAWEAAVDATVAAYKLFMLADALTSAYSKNSEARKAFEAYAACREAEDAAFAPARAAAQDAFIREALALL